MPKKRGFNLHLRLIRAGDASPAHQLATQRAQRDTEAQQSTLPISIRLNRIVHRTVLHLQWRRIPNYRAQVSFVRGLRGEI